MGLNQSVHVVGSREIPSEVVHTGARYRAFAAHETLRSLLPDGGRFSLAWLEAGEDEIVERTVAFDTILLVFRGEARLLDGRCVAPGDVVTIPAQGSYRLVVNARYGLEALAVTFAGSATNDDDSQGISSLAALIQRNEERVRLASQGAMFKLVDDGTLDDPAKRAAFLRQLRPLSDTFQKTIIARQATCSDQTYEAKFHEHFMDEFGHNTLLPRDDVDPTPDPVMSATLAWFTHQMLVRDNAEKAVLVHLVLEAAAEAFFSKATTREVFRASGALDYYEAHLEDGQHKDLGAHLLAGLHPLAYRRLHRILEDGWDMFDAMGNRLAELVRLDADGAA